MYQIIEDAGSKGIWMREIRGRSNIAQSELTRCLRTLESRKLIKSVRSVQAARRKVRERERECKCGCVIVWVREGGRECGIV